MYPLSKCTKSGSSRKPVTCGVRESSPVIFHENYFASSDPTNGRWGVVMGYSSNLGIWPSGMGGGGKRKSRKEEEGTEEGEERRRKIKQIHLEGCEPKNQKTLDVIIAKIKPINNGPDRSPIRSCLGKLVTMRGERVQIRLPHVTHCLHFAVSAFSPSGSHDRWLACFSRLRHVGKHDQPHLSE